MELFAVAFWVQSFKCALNHPPLVLSEFRERYFSGGLFATRYVEFTRVQRVPIAFNGFTRILRMITDFLVLQRQFRFPPFILVPPRVLKCY